MSKEKCTNGCLLIRMLCKYDMPVYHWCGGRTCGISVACMGLPSHLLITWPFVLSSKSIDPQCVASSLYSLNVYVLQSTPGCCQCVNPFMVQMHTQQEANQL